MFELTLCVLDAAVLELTLCGLDAVSIYNSRVLELARSVLDTEPLIAPLLVRKCGACGDAVRNDGIAAVTVLAEPRWNNGM